jgi:outer membrane protein OmpA-like peptidoglycan-associated protein
VPVYRVMVVEHGLDAVNYQYGAEPTKIDFRGTVLLTSAKGEATVQSRRGRTEIGAKFENVPAPTRFGTEYLTYVLWALSPEGAARNLGEIIPDTSDRAKLRVTTDLQTFAMIVTAEPYANVQQPSDVVVLENHVRPDTVGTVRQIQPKAELLPRGQYTFQVPSNPQPGSNGAPKKVSMNQYEAILQVYQAQNAIAIARAANAERYAPDTLAAAERALAEAQRLQGKKANSSAVIQNAREAAQDADDARTISERRKQEEDRGAVATPAAPNAQAQPPASRDEANREAPDSGFWSRMRAIPMGSLLTHDTPRGLTITLPENAFKGSNLTGDFSQTLEPVATALASQPAVKVEISAYTGNAGSELQSWERAQAIRNALVTAGVHPNQINVRGYSEKDNERVEILIAGR